MLHAESEKRLRSVKAESKLKSYITTRNTVYRNVTHTEVAGDYGRSKFSGPLLKEYDNKDIKRKKKRKRATTATGKRKRNSRGNLRPLTAAHQKHQKSRI